MRLPVLLLLIAPLAADPAAALKDLEAVGKTPTARTAVAAAQRAADAVLFCPGKAGTKAAWSEAADSLDGLADRIGGGVHAGWVRLEAAVLRWRIAPDDGLKFCGRIQREVRRFDESKEADAMYLRAAALHLDIARREDANWFGAAAGLVYLHRKMQLIGAGPEATTALKAAIEWTEGRNDGKGGVKKFAAAYARLVPLMKNETPLPFAAARFNDVVASLRPTDPRFKYKSVPYVRGELHLGIPISSVWQIHGERIEQLVDSGPQRSINIAVRPSTISAQSAVNAALRKTAITGSRKRTSPRKTTLGSVEGAWDGDVSGQDVHGRFRRVRVIAAQGKKATYVIRITEYAAKPKADGGATLEEILKTAAMR